MWLGWVRCGLSWCGEGKVLKWWCLKTGSEVVGGGRERED